MPGAPLTPKKAAERRQQWIEKCEEIHDNKYDYSKVIFVNKRSEVTITCPEHGDFPLTPQKHLDGHGCPSCPKRQRARSANAKTYTYQGRIYTSLEALGNHLGVSRRTLGNRINAGWPEERWGIRFRTSFKNIEFKGVKYSTLKKLANHLGIHHRTLLGRIERGWKEEDWGKSAEDARKHREKQHHEIAERVANQTQFRLHGLYKGRFVNTRFFCLIHHEIHEATPGNVLSGQGLTCCMKASRKMNAELQTFTNEEYDQKIQAFERVERIEDYINNHTPIKHKCLLHGEIHPVIPASALKGGGLRCCKIAAIQANADRDKDRASKELKEVLKKKNPSIVWVGGEYKGDKEKLLFHCLTHDEVHENTPGRVKSGTGLQCCLKAARIRSGQKMGLINGGMHDNVWRALTNQLRRVSGSETFLYLYESPFEGYRKYGISNGLNRREKAGGYGEQLIEPHTYTKRSEAVLIEQAFKYGWGIDFPEVANDYDGKTELTTLTPLEFLEIIENLEQALLQMGDWGFAEEYCDPYEVTKAREYLSVTSLPNRT